MAKKIILGVIGFLVVIGIIGGIGGDSAEESASVQSESRTEAVQAIEPEATASEVVQAIEPKATASEVVQASEPKATATPLPPGFGDGTHLVGTDIQPGLYRATQDCYWARLSNTSGEFSAILANGNTRGPAVVQVLETDRAFESKRCGRWTEVAGAITSDPNAAFGDGTYIVGVDIAAGTWRTAGTDSCYWQRSSGFSGELGDIIANDNARGSAIVTITANDAGFTSKRCGDWAKAVQASEPRATATSAIQVSEPKATAVPLPPGFGDGTHLVGTDIQPGLYRATQDCYWARLSNTSGELSAILANGNTRGPAVVQIQETDRAFESKRCGRWTEVAGAITSDPNAAFGDGTYIVGVDIAAGTWRTAGTDNCYWQRSSGFSGELGDIIANDNARGSAIVTIAANDVGFTSKRCGDWAKVE